MIEDIQTNEGESNYKIVQDLFKLEKNLDGKTELYDTEINLIIKRYFFAKCLSKEAITIDELNEDLINKFKRLRVSLQRKGRSEAVQLGKAGDDGMKSNFWKSYVGLK